LDNKKPADPDNVSPLPPTPTPLAVAVLLLLLVPVDMEAAVASADARDNVFTNASSDTPFWMYNSNTSILHNAGAKSSRK
jgi:hypothetical protein